MAKKKHDPSAVMKTIPDIEGREFQHELPLCEEHGPPDFSTPIATGAQVLMVHTAQLTADRNAWPRLVRRMIDSTGQTQVAIANAIGVQKQSIHQWVAGYRKNPSMLMFLRLAAACDCRVLIEYPRRVK